MEIVEISPEQRQIEAAARELGVGVIQLQGWRARGRVAYRYRLPITERLREQGVALDPAAFDRLSVWFRRGAIAASPVEQESGH